MDLPIQYIGDRSPSGSFRLMDAVAPAVDLLPVDRAAESGSELHRQPRLTPALLDEDLPERGERDHEHNLMPTRCKLSTCRPTACQFPDGGSLAVLAFVATEQPYWERIRSLKARFGLTEDDLVRGSKRLTRSTLQALMRPYKPQKAGASNSSRYPRPERIKYVAEALGVPPEEFPEYRLAKARELLDERHHGLDQALTNLAEITEALDALAAERKANGGEPPRCCLSCGQPATTDLRTLRQQGHDPRVMLDAGQDRLGLLLG